MKHANEAVGARPFLSEVQTLRDRADLLAEAENKEAPPAIGRAEGKSREERKMYERRFP